MKQIILYGGGLDSTAVLLYVLNTGSSASDIELFHVDYGQKAYLKELEAANFFAKKYGVKVFSGRLDLSFSSATIMKGTAIGNKDTNRLELRNLALLSYAASYAASVYPDETSVLHVGFHKEPEGSGFLDAKTPFLRLLERSINTACLSRVVTDAVFQSYTRQEIMAYGINNDADFITRSYTCYEESECGECAHCTEKANMLKAANPNS